uniref:Uncharacterized protein n=1 Tax=Arundo donax TaxID=35708 RepID=A0A0A9E7E4_ARUDO
MRDMPSSALGPMAAAEATTDRSSGRMPPSFLSRTMPSCAASSARLLCSGVQMSAAPRAPYVLVRGSPSKWPSRIRTAKRLVRALSTSCSVSFPCWIAAVACCCT